MFGPLNVFKSLPEASSTHSATAQQSPQGSSMKGLCAVVGIGTTAVLHSVLKMGMDCAEDPFNMGMFYNSRCHSKWVCFQIPNTHIRASLYWSRPPGGGGGAGQIVCIPI